jgi:hypothetical protein
MTLPALEPEVKLIEIRGSKIDIYELRVEDYDKVAKIEKLQKEGGQTAELIALMISFIAKLLATEDSDEEKTKWAQSLPFNALMDFVTAIIDASTEAKEATEVKKNMKN